MQISERKRKILKTLIDTYISTCEPISSNKIKQDCLPEVSSATIRSELVALEDMGFLVQPHTSSGRIPSSKAYRYYVDNLVSDEEINQELVDIKNKFDKNFGDVEEIVKNAAKVLSDVTNYTSMVVLGEVNDLVLKEIKLVDIGDNTALVIIITNSGVLKDKVIDLPDNVDGKYFISANNMLNDIFAGMTVGEVTRGENFASVEIGEYREVFMEVLDMLSSYKRNSEGRIYLEGADKIFGYKEYENVDNIKNFMTVINTKEKIRSLIDQDEDIEISVKIGKDESGTDNMAVVTAKCIIGGRQVGKVAVIGPERMDYKKVINVLGNFTKAIDDIKE